MKRDLELMRFSPLDESARNCTIKEIPLQAMPLIRYKEITRLLYVLFLIVTFAAYVVWLLKLTA